MNASGPSSDRLWFWFAVTSIVFVSVLAVSPLKDYFSEYRSYQNQYQNLLFQKAGSRKDLREAESFQVGIRQIWIPSLDNSVDRCTTCHLGLESPSMQQAEEPFLPHPRTPHTPDDFRGFGCVVCHRGQGRATTLDEAHGKVRDWDSPMLPLTYTEASCGRCHEGGTVPEASLLSQGRKLMDQAGCYACHQLKGHEKWKRSGPDLNGLSLKTYPEWLRQWLKDPSSLRSRTWMPDFHLSDEDVESLVSFLWIQPATPTQQLVGETFMQGGDYDRGKKLFRQSRCISCHTVDGRGNGSAAELSGIGSKVNRRWLVSFLKDPHRFQPGTLMPHYHFSDQDLLDLTRYLSEEMTDSSAPASTGSLRPSPQLIQHGEKLFRKFGCGGCHALVGQPDSVRIGPELTGIGDKPVNMLDYGQRDDLPRTLPDWLAAKLTEPRSFGKQLKMPTFSFTREQAEAVVTALLSSGARPVPEPYRQPAHQAAYTPPGRFGKLVQEYRCLSCHQIQGTGGDISTAPLTAEGSRVKEPWLKGYLLSPRTVRPLLVERMIPLRMSEEEAGFMANFMENVYVDNTIADDLFPKGPPPDRVRRGRKLFYERYGCQSCHMVNNTGGFYGPLLDGLGDRLKPGWVSWFLQGPQRSRADARCPDYGMDSTDAEDLAAYIADISSPGPRARDSARKGGGK